MTSVISCPECKYDFPLGQNPRPHCGRPAFYANVIAAANDEEVKELDRRYQEAIEHGKTSGGSSTLAAFETALSDSQAVIARPLHEVERLVQSDRNLYATYHQILDGGLRTTPDDDLNLTRIVVEGILFPGYKEQIRFAALSLDGNGLTHYGEWMLLLRADMIAHRASVLEENSINFVERHRIKAAKPGDLPRGYRATWDTRARLGVAKLWEKVCMAKDVSEFSSLVLHNGPTSLDDDFIEVHIWGPMTIRTVKQIGIAPSRKRGKNIVAKALREKLNKTAPEVQVVEWTR